MTSSIPMAVDLFDRFIAALEDPARRQCVGNLRTAGPKGDAYCVEGVAAEVLIDAYPERFSWEEWCPALFWLLDKAQADDGAQPYLATEHWNLLHPCGDAIQVRAGLMLGSAGVLGVNDGEQATLPQMAAALRQARAEVESE